MVVALYRLEFVLRLSVEHKRKLFRQNASKLFSSQASPPSPMNGIPTYAAVASNDLYIEKKKLLNIFQIETC